MCLKALSLRSFRSYAWAHISFPDTKPVVVTGPNGAGKTNFLEALSLLVPGKGLRHAAYGDMGKKWHIHAQLDTDEGEVRIASTFCTQGARRIHINERASTGTQLNQWVGTSWLTPENTFWQSMSERRRCLDRCVMSLFPTYIRHHHVYDRSMRERTRLLLTTAPNAVWLDSLEVQMGQHGQAIAQGRQEFLTHFNAMHTTPFPQPYLEVTDSLESSETFTQKLALNRPTDQQAGRCTWGPHTAHFLLYHPHKGIEGRLCSTGEQKMLLLSLVLRHAHLARKRRGGAFLLLLDETVAHLDVQHRSILFEEILANPWQTFMTGTDVALFEPLRNHATFTQPHLIASSIDVES